ncbi:hypothetical protein L2U69_03540 [Zavarzinia compransoris]|uniref:hypothetical protein n=1 Tax=Zavarzinia marina TaxID=2911065 RepID=UPI001F2A95A3|nr:hypothetical protein [Zavarzinia marina]MCF4164711.1 hypothetical protein [Zavarzinia marina]
MARSAKTHGSAARARRLAGGLFGLLLAAGLSACGGGEAPTAAADPANPCPTVSVLSDATTLTRFAEGAGRTPDDVTFEVEMIDAKGVCEATGPDQVTATVAMSLFLRRGPAGGELRSVDVPFFVALTETNTRVVSRASYVTSIPIASNRITGGVVEHVTITVPLQGKSPFAYEIIGGMQLTAAELAEERRRRGR